MTMMGADSKKYISLENEDGMVVTDELVREECCFVHSSVLTGGAWEYIVKLPTGEAIEGLKMYLLNNLLAR